MPSPRPQPEQAARQQIDAALEAAGWVVQDHALANLSAGRGVALREFPMKRGHGFADYLLFVDGQAVGALEAKKEGTTLTGVELQARKYSDGLPRDLDAPQRPLPFLYVSTGVETRFSNRLDPVPRSREVFAIHRPETLAEWLQSEPLATWIAAASPDLEGGDPTASTARDAPRSRPSTLRSRLRAMPPLPEPKACGLWPNQHRAITNLERSLADNRPRALLQMATGSGKSLTAVASIYRLIKFGGARRVLFLVDRTNLGEQAETEFLGYRTYDDHRKFTELYGIHRLSGAKIHPAAKVVVTTIQRLYSMLRGEPLEAEAEEASAHLADDLPPPPTEVVYNPAIPPEFFDIIFIDECHRSIYSEWQQVFDYFDAFLIGLTATPALHTYGFFHQNVVMEFSVEQAIAAGVNVECEIYRIQTEITEHGSKVKAGPGVVVGVRDRNSGRRRWERPDDDITYTAKQLDRDVVALDQIRLIVKTFRKQLPIDIFPGRTEVPKTLIFAKDDSHAEDIVLALREEFCLGDEFCQKITYKAGDPKARLQEFRTAYNPRIAVTVDMIATGTDVRPIEIVMFMRSVKSKVLYEQMRGRGGRVVSPAELTQVTGDATVKDHFVLVDCVGVTETPLQESRPLERSPHVSFNALLDHVGHHGANPDKLSSLASRLVRLDRRCGPEERRALADHGVRLADLASAIVDALDPDVQADAARRAHGLPAGTDPSDAQLAAAEKALLKAAVAPLAAAPAAREHLKALKARFEQILDDVSVDRLLAAGPSPEARERARELVTSFEAYLRERRDELDALQFLYSQPKRRRRHLAYEDVKALADAIEAPPRQWTPERLWRAYEQLDQSKVRGRGRDRLLTDIVSLVRYATGQADALVPYPELIDERFDNWRAQQANKGRSFTAEQGRWLEMIRDHIKASIEIDVDDFDFTPFVEEGGRGRAARLFGGELAAIVGELNEALSA